MFVPFPDKSVRAQAGRLTAFMRSFQSAFSLVILLLWILGFVAAAQSNSPQTASQSPPPSNSQPAPIQTTATVNATLSTEAPAPIAVLDEKSIEEMPGTNLDDSLRQAPGFSLFRRSSIVVANPMRQGVSLRAIGSSRDSRTLVAASCTGQRIPQVPKQQGTAQVVYSAKSTLVLFRVRAFGLQLDDDLNQFKMPGYAALQLSAEQHLTKVFPAWPQLKIC